MLPRSLRTLLLSLLLSLSGGEALALTSLSRDTQTPSSRPAEDGIPPLPSLSSRVGAAKIIGGKIFTYADQGAITLVSGGTYLISGGHVIGGFYYKSPTTITRPSDQPLYTSETQPIARLSDKHLRLSQPATQLDLLDMQGRKLLSARGVQEARIDVPTGIYLLRSIFPTTTFICKLIVR